MLSLRSIDLVVLFLSLYLLHRVWTNSRDRLSGNRLPGPKGWPIIGNIFDIPKEEVHVAYMKMGSQYDNGLLYLNMAGTSMLILNSAEAANDLLVERSALYSNRPRSPMVGELMGWNPIIGFLPYGSLWRKSRALFMHQFSSSNLNIYHKPLLAEGIHGFLRSLLDTPEDFDNHVHRLFGGSILSLAYGISVDDPRNDPFLQLSDHALQALAEAGIPGTYLVDSFPSLKHVPSWFPGAGFKKKAAYEREFVEGIMHKTLDFVKRNIANGTARSSVAFRVLQKMHEDGSWSQSKEDLLRNVLGTIYAAGVDTTSTVTRTIMLSLVRNPEILRRGQAAVDAVIGHNRLPAFEDEGKIPYVDAICMEGLRYRPIAPFAIPHHLEQPDVYKGYYVPRNTIVMGNCWAILHDPVTYGEDVDEFRPERFLNEDGTLSKEIPYPEAAFGFGRRICPGRHLAQSTLWLIVTSLLACFDLNKAVNEDGEEIDPSTDFIEGFLLYPRPYECSIKPRSKAAEDLIRLTSVD